MSAKEDPAADPATALWQAIAAAYARPGIAPLCLRLQQQGGVDVVLLLILCRSLALGAALPLADLHRLQALTAPWRAKAILPLRALRQDLRRPVEGVDSARQESFRDALKALELQAERLQVALLAEALAQQPAKPAPADAQPTKARPPEGPSPEGWPADEDPALRAFLGATPVSAAELGSLVAAFRP